MIPVRQVVPDAVAEIIRKAPLSREKVAFAWRNVVGPAISQATSVNWGDDGVLRVKTRDAAWQREVERSASLIRSRLDSLLGERVVATLAELDAHDLGAELLDDLRDFFDRSARDVRGADHVERGAVFLELGHRRQRSHGRVLAHGR